MARSGNKKSGYTSLPARVQLRNLDNLKNSYPSVLRTGDRNRQGNYAINFDDTHTHIYSRKIADNFEESGFNNETELNSNKWQSSNGNIIKKEIINNHGCPEESRCFIFSGKGDSEGRWLQTTEKIKNPFITFNVILGPHNNIKGGLQLSKPFNSQNLLVQMSYNGLTWRTIKTINATTNLKEFYQYKQQLPPSPRKKITLSTRDFNTRYLPGEDTSFFIRIIEEASSYGTKLKSIWALSDIDITFHKNTNVIYPAVNNTTMPGMEVINTIVANSHTTSSLTAEGRVHKGVSDTGYIDRDFKEEIKPFNETTAVSNASYDFLQDLGVDPNINKGFRQKYFQKTRIDIDLSPSEETEIGYVNPADTRFPDAYRSTDGQQLMVYWNKNIKRWEKIAQPVTFNNNNLTYSLSNSRGNLQGVLTGSAVGFSCLGFIATGSVNQAKINTLHPKELVRKYVRPIDNFNFPFGGQYHATSSQVLKAKDLGINHPFLLEGTSLKFDAKLDIAGTRSGRPTDIYTSWQFGMPISYN